MGHIFVISLFICFFIFLFSVFIFFIFCVEVVLNVSVWVVYQVGPRERWSFCEFMRVHESVCERECVCEVWKIGYASVWIV